MVLTIRYFVEGLADLKFRRKLLRISEAARTLDSPAPQLYHEHNRLSILFAKITGKTFENYFR